MHKWLSHGIIQVGFKIYNILAKAIDLHLCASVFSKYYSDINLVKA